MSLASRRRQGRASVAVVAASLVLSLGLAGGSPAVAAERPPAADPSGAGAEAAVLGGLRGPAVGPDGSAETAVDALAADATAAGAGGSAAARGAGDAAPAAAGDLAVTGRGFGHGIGLSQYGAKGRAEAGKTAQQIVQAYYWGTSAGTASDARAIDVWLTADTDGALNVVREAGLRLRGSNPAKGVTRSLVTLPATVSGATPDRWRVKRASGAWRVQARAKGAWVNVSTAAIRATLSGATRVTVTSADGTVRNVVGSTARQYRGKLSANLDQRTVRVTATTTFTHYLRSVVPSEMPTYWHAQALGAQAIAARTYASYERASSYRPWWYDTCDSASCQVFRGEADYTTSGSLVATYVWSATNKAVAATAGQVRTYGGKPAFTQFSASNGGYTVKGSQPYLRAFADPYDEFDVWKRTVTASQVAAAYGIGTLRTVTFTRDGKGAYGGRVKTITLTGSSGTRTVTGDSFRITFGLLSTLFTAKVG
ncbi:SpoIID/LytB domain-containing protein [Cellulomonas sp. DKR-3]|uniref:SpoIID/LytB domain-containing protein n=1 Tax=Cellulomonas fulva TaxID=2835530 RepID=A0ABS5U2E4_9CELL|nr:SpoIID/LytB domain-containing protein [Cellulomonas fulva]MBT0995565.1 SpoIID/LytB domain-containing protein [Cellulomonas fulva]